MSNPYAKRAGSRADILGLGFLPYISPHYYLLQPVRRGDLFYVFVLQHLLPQRLVLPTLGETHHGGLNGGIFGKKRLEVLNEGVLGIDAVKPVGNAAEAWI